MAMEQRGGVDQRAAQRMDARGSQEEHGGFDSQEQRVRAMQVAAEIRRMQATAGEQARERLQELKGELREILNMDSEEGPQDVQEEVDPAVEARGEQENKDIQDSLQGIEDALLEVPAWAHRWGESMGKEYPSQNDIDDAASAIAEWAVYVDQAYQFLDKQALTNTEQDDLFSKLDEFDALMTKMDPRIQEAVRAAQSKVAA